MLVVEAKTLSEFLKTIETIGPSHTKTVLRFCQEVINNTITYEQRLNNKERENEVLLRSLDELEYQHEVEGNISDGD